MMNEFIFLYGPPGAGKSEVGRHLAKNLGMDFYDLDEEIQANRHKSIAEIFCNSGEISFRAIENKMLKKLLSLGGGVISLGGGTLLDLENRRLVDTHGQVLLLTAPPEILIHRLMRDPNPRPLLTENIEAHLRNLLEDRSQHYTSFQNIVDTTQNTVETCAWACQISLGTYNVNSVEDGYDVRISPGGLKNIGQILQQRGYLGHIAVVSDENVGPLYAEQVIKSLDDAAFSTAYVQIAAGEKAKTIKTVEILWDAFLKAGMARDSLVIALGGGVVSDIAGFAAATYLRGIPWVILPTTLLAIADASLGGKTGIDLEQGKNLVGAFHPPQMVLSDPEVLKTLPDVEMCSGMAEILKHGIIGDPHLFSLCEAIDVIQWTPHTETIFSEIIHRAVAVKIKIIEADPMEKGIRAVLNLGHTIGHALEVTSAYQLNHGQAVAIGLSIEAQLAEEIGLAGAGTARRISDALKKIGLPIAIPSQLDPMDIIHATNFDKKKRAGKVRFALPVNIGEVKPNIVLKNLRRMNAFSDGNTWS